MRAAECERFEKDIPTLSKHPAGNLYRQEHREEFCLFWICKGCWEHLWTTSSVIYKDHVSF